MIARESLVLRYNYETLGKLKRPGGDKLTPSPSGGF
jgi:hypothetical protein